MREYVSPVTLVAQRIPRAVLERLYGICLPSPSEGEDEARAPTAHELLSTYAGMACMARWSRVSIPMTMITVAWTVMIMLLERSFSCLFLL